VFEEHLKIIRITPGYLLFAYPSYKNWISISRKFLKMFLRFHFLLEVLSWIH